MLTSLALIYFLFGLAIGAACKAIRVPAIIGMMLTGIVLGPQALNLLDPKNSQHIAGPLEVGVGHHHYQSRTVHKSLGT